MTTEEVTVSDVDELEIMLMLSKETGTNKVSVSLIANQKARVVLWFAGFNQEGTIINLKPGVELRLFNPK